MSSDFSTAIRNVRVRVQFITPDMAEAWLKRNLKNRKQRVKVIRRYAAEMTAQQWLMSDSAIMFDRDGNLVNGQHRLEACVKAKQGFWNIVADNVPNECFLTFDQGERRKVDDLLELAGVGDANNKLGSIINAMISTGESNKGKLSTQDAVDFVEEHKDAITFVIECFGHASQQGGSRATVKGVVGRAFYHADHNRIREFVRLLLSAGFETTPGNEAVYLLREFLRKCSRDSNKSEIHRKIERALYAYVNGEQLGRLHEASEEYFPLPEEPGYVGRATKLGTLPKFQATQVSRPAAPQVNRPAATQPVHRHERQFAGSL